MSGGTGETQNIDPDIKSRQLGLYNDVTSYLNQTPYQSYGGPLVAGQQPFQQAAQNFLGQQLFGQQLGFNAPQTFGPYEAAPFQFGTQNPDPSSLYATDDTVVPVGEPDGLDTTVPPPQDYDPTGGGQGEFPPGIVPTGGVTSGPGAGSRNGMTMNAQSPTREQYDTYQNILATQGEDAARAYQSQVGSGGGMVMNAQYGPGQYVGGTVQPTTAGDRIGFDGGFDLLPPGGEGVGDPRTGGGGGTRRGGGDVTLPGGDGPTRREGVRGTGDNYQPGGTGPQMPRGFQPPGFSQNAFASNVAQGLTGYNPQQVQGGQFTGDRLAELQNPFQQQVIDQSISDLDRARQIAMQSGPGSSSAGAYGGSRTGVREAETNRAYLDSVARQSAQLRSAGFDKAAGLMGQELGMGLSADLANQSAGLQGAGLNLNAAQSLNQFGGDRLNRTLGIGSALNQIGTQNQALAQRQIDADYGQFQQARNWPMQGFGLQQGVLTGLPVGMNFNPGSNPGAGFAGGALGGAGVGAAFGPWGAGLGALGGGLLGLLG